MTDASPGSNAHKAGEICFRSVSKQYPGRERPAVQDLSFEVPAGEICILIGPSGCGKTTALKLVNRLIPMSGGDITIDDRSINDHEVTELRRGIGYVFQEIGLFPHMTIEDNIGSVPRLLGWKKDRIRARASELLELVGLDPTGDLKRYPGEFSGGQQQRIGVARAMAVDPPIMLMDEPFGAIDPITRERLQNDFLRLQSEIKKTIVFVTHDIDEAIKMGDRIAIMREGQLVQLDTSDKLLASPSDDFVASFVGADRGLKRLRLWKLRDLDLEPAGTTPAPSAPIDSSLRDALSLMLTDGTRELDVTGEDGSVAGRVRLDQIIGYVGPEGEATAQDEVARA